MVLLLLFLFIYFLIFMNHKISTKHRLLMAFRQWVYRQLIMKSPLTFLRTHTHKRTLHTQSICAGEGGEANKKNATHSFNSLQIHTHIYTHVHVFENAKETVKQNENASEKQQHGKRRETREKGTREVQFFWLMKTKQLLFDCEKQRRNDLHEANCFALLCLLCKMI